MTHFLLVCLVIIILVVVTTKAKRKKLNKYVRQFRVCNFVDGEMYEINTKYRHCSQLCTIDMIYCSRTKGFFSTHNHLSLRELRNNYHYVEIKHATKVKH